MPACLHHKVLLAHLSAQVGLGETFPRANIQLGPKKYMCLCSLVFLHISKAVCREITQTWGQLRIPDLGHECHTFCKCPPPPPNQKNSEPCANRSVSCISSNHQTKRYGIVQYSASNNQSKTRVGFLPEPLEEPAERGSHQCLDPLLEVGGGHKALTRGFTPPR